MAGSLFVRGHWRIGGWGQQGVPPFPPALIPSATVGSLASRLAHKRPPHIERFARAAAHSEWAGALLPR